MDLYYLLLIFAISFISNATPFFGAPYTLIATTFLLKFGVSIVNFVEVVLVSGIGASTAKSVMYGVGFGVGSRLKHNKNVMYFHRVAKGRSFYLILFVTSIIPFLPLDDVVFLMGGAGKTSLFKMLEVAVISKILKSILEIGIEVEGIVQISKVINVSPVNIGIISSVVFLVLGVFIFKIDWESLHQRVERYLKSRTSGVS
ncbi:hypothetical protein GWK48_08330 [Metallosphaera tengchongensis]|uniref:VTT domain-containing protein n=1 Tax=Metallosphaera tengchongensis TaxID=1532350 RepID=A0A6N0NYC2_9CREN|nr:hypothetical protein [Metallosphaera tengchongensis]QKR00378.1 hypothetical protein GWK48_08330 [Metallosphaera tengchongensis]